MTTEEIQLPVKFAQPSESTPAKTVLVHISKMESFICSLNPRASLYEDVTDEDDIRQCFNGLGEYLKTKNIRLITVEDALFLKGKEKELENLARSSLTYEKEQGSPQKQQKQVQDSVIPENKREKKRERLRSEDEKQILENLKHQQGHPIFYQMVLSFISYHFDDIQLLHELSRIFYKIDRNTDGKITKEDLWNAYEEAGEKITKSELEEIINMVDFDKNGFIEYEEFIRVCIPEDRLFTESNLKNAFDLFDMEKKGSITHMQVVDALQRENKINPKMIELLKNEVSNMGEELLDFDKFKKLMEELSVQ